ncbi:MAG: phenylalanyl-tRNA synthetase beta chain [Frankiaceae bacterium]|jgi:phenylalanyl-tRNA synthetase beta chain|nr:phenylalanyl-tRNA synthetase beta chain [Frankiaceae bacterium]
MRVPISWLRDYAPLAADISAADISTALVRAGLEVERVDAIGEGVSGVVVGEVVSFDEEPQSNGKTIRWCQVQVAEGAEPRGIVCGAANFVAGDRVAVALPGSVLPGGFTITARKTYGHVSDGMMCAVDELGIGSDHTGILILPADSPLGADVVELLSIGDHVLDIAVKADRSYCLSVRGVAREAATAYDVLFTDPADVPVAPAAGDGYPVRIEDTVGCDRYVARVVRGVDPLAPSPLWLQRRLTMAGMRSISLAVDVTNHVLLDVGQPLHAFDAGKVRGEIVVRRAVAGEHMRSLDGVDRRLSPEDLLITDDSGPIALAGVMGGASTEIDGATTDIIIESAHFDPATIARTARRHRLPSEASRRFERGVDLDVADAAAELAVRLLVELGGGTADPATTDVDHRQPRQSIRLDPAFPSRIAGIQYTTETVVRRLRDVGCDVSGDGTLSVLPPSWRPDLRENVDLVEEVLRLEGYDAIPSVLPPAPAGGGLTRVQRQRRSAARALAAVGFLEVLSYPFVGEAVLDTLGVPAGDPRRRLVRVSNPLSDDEPYLRTTLLPGLLTAAARNVGRGSAGFAVYEAGSVFFAVPGTGPVASPSTAHRPSEAELAALDAVLPEQPRHLAGVLVGDADPAGWWGEGRPTAWSDAVAAAVTAARAVGAHLNVRQAELAPWHPGRCAALLVGDAVVGHAGELHPRVVAALGLPERAAAFELDLDAVCAAAPETPVVPTLSTYPPVGRDVALVVAADVPQSAVETALRDGAGALLESLDLFDVYTGAPIPDGSKSLAYALRFRAPDRTLTDDEANDARDAAVAEAGHRTAAVLRS